MNFIRRFSVIGINIFLSILILSTIFPSVQATSNQREELIFTELDTLNWTEIIKYTYLDANSQRYIMDRMENKIDQSKIDEFSVYGDIIRDGEVTTGEVKAYQYYLVSDLTIGEYYGDLLMDGKPGCLEACTCTITNGEGEVYSWDENLELIIKFDLIFKYGKVKESENEHKIKITNTGNIASPYKIKIPEPYDIDYVKGSEEYSTKGQTVNLQINPDESVTIKIIKEDPAEQMIIIYSVLAFFIIGLALVIFVVIRKRRAKARKNVVEYDPDQLRPDQIIQNYYDNLNHYRKQLPSIAPPPTPEPPSPNPPEPQPEVTKSFGCSHCDKPFNAKLINESYKVACPACGGGNIILPLSYYK
jgi:DNA-directed RNA polymerase subunit RPC12/RpoP